MFLLFQIIDDQVLCVHGGLSPLIRTLDQIRTIKRNQEIPHKGAFCDILYNCNGKHFLYLLKYLTKPSIDLVSLEIFI